MTEADFSDKGLGAPGAIVVASFMAKWWALSSPHHCRYPHHYPLTLSTLLFPLTSGALTSLNLSENKLCGIDEDGDGEYDASGVTALADAIGKHQ